MPVYDQFPLAPFLDYLKFEKRYSKHTLLSYQNDLEQFAAYLASQFDSPALKAITPTLVRSWPFALTATMITTGKFILIAIV